MDLTLKGQLDSKVFELKLSDNDVKKALSACESNSLEFVFIAKRNEDNNQKTAETIPKMFSE